jgi:peroxiredoxin
MGNVRWKHEGELQVEALIEALRSHPSLPAGGSRQALRLKVREGDRAPDFVFEFVPNRLMPLHTLRGHAVDLVFWTSWAEPSLLELAHAAARSGEASNGRKLVLAINDGEAVEHAREVFERHGVAATLVPDPDRRIARLYGIHCWPTTVSIDERGRVWDVQMGRTHENAPAGRI